MRVRVQKWGNSLALRIPRSFAAETALDPGSEVDLTVEEGRLVVTPIEKQRYELAELLAEITDGNLHEEIDTGDAMGGEAW